MLSARATTPSNHRRYTGAPLVYVAPMLIRNVVETDGSGEKKQVSFAGQTTDLSKQGGSA